MSIRYTRHTRYTRYTRYTGARVYARMYARGWNQPTQEQRVEPGVPYKLRGLSIWHDDPLIELDYAVQADIPPHAPSSPFGLLAPSLHSPHSIVIHYVTSCLFQSGVQSSYTGAVRNKHDFWFCCVSPHMWRHNALLVDSVSCMQATTGVLKLLRFTDLQIVQYADGHRVRVQEPTG